MWHPGDLYAAFNGPDGFVIYDDKIMILGRQLPSGPMRVPDKVAECDYGTRLTTSRFFRI